MRYWILAHENNIII